MSCILDNAHKVGRARAHAYYITAAYVECRAGDTAVTVQTLSEVIGALACAQLVHVYVTGMSGGSYNSWQRPHSGVITQPVQDKCNVHLIVTVSWV
jgi:hypothetical protein